LPDTADRFNTSEGASRPFGEPVEWRPSRAVERAPIEGELVTLVPVDPAAHGAALYAVSHSPAATHLWDYLPNGPFASEHEFGRWLGACAASPDPLFFTIVLRASGQPAGMCSYLRMDPPHGTIEIGYIWFSPELQRTPAATEAILVLARHAFDDLRYRRLEWKCNALNAPSRVAADRLGFTYEGVFRQHMVVKGRNRDTAWYAMLDGEWPAIRRSFERWLAADNFDEHGRQRRTLRDVRAGG
jgi:RimJ/RimL family protein N-acetyltransferase